MRAQGFNFGGLKPVQAFRVGALAAAFVCQLAMETAYGQEPAPQVIARGKQLLTAQCGRCHQIALTGQSPLREAPPFRDVMRRYKPEALEEALAEGISTGHEAMPEFQFEPDDVTAIIAYFGTLRAKR
jgi:cytochrome c